MNQASNAFVSGIEKTAGVGLSLLLLVLGAEAPSFAAAMSITPPSIVTVAVTTFSPRFKASNFNTFSPRLSALQLNVAVQDEGNVIGLDKFGNNPAGLILDEPKNRLAVGGLYQNDDIKFKGNTKQGEKNFTPGLVGIYRNNFQALRVDGSYQSDKQTETGLEDKKITQSIGSLAYNHKLDNLLLGADVGFSSEKETSGDQKLETISDPLAYNLGLGYDGLVNGHMTLGANYSHDKQKVGDWGRDTLDQIGVQSILTSENLLSAGINLNYKTAKSEFSDTQVNTKVEGPGADLTVRLTPPSAPVIIGARLLTSRLDIRESLSGPTLYDLTYQNMLGALGISLVDSKIGLVGVETSIYRDRSSVKTGPDSSVINLDFDRTSLGGEYDILPQLIARASVSYTSFKQEMTNDAVNFGGGLGYLFGEKGKVDLSLTNEQTKAFPSVTSSHLITVNVLGTWYF